MFQCCFILFLQNSPSNCPSSSCCTARVAFLTLSMYWQYSLSGQTVAFPAGSCWNLGGGQSVIKHRKCEGAGRGGGCQGWLRAEHLATSAPGYLMSPCFARWLLGCFHPPPSPPWHPQVTLEPGGVRSGSPQKGFPSQLLDARINTWITKYWKTIWTR